MRSFFHRLAVCALLASVMAGCSTPGRRARQHAGAFHRLSPADQRLVLQGKVRPGLSQEGVFIAWGEPDEKRTTSDDKGGAGTERWIYRQRVTLLEPPNSYEYFGPYPGYGDVPVGRWPDARFALGNLGYEGLLQSHPHVRSLDTLRVAEFSAGQVDRYKTAGDSWSGKAGAGTVSPR